MQPGNFHRRGVLLITLAALLWSLGGLGIKAVEAGPLVVAFYRCLFAAITLFLLGRGRGASLSPQFVVSVVAYAACLTTFVVATKWTTAANAIFLQYSGVIWVLLFSPIVTKDALHRRDSFAILAALAGMALFFVGGLEAAGMAGNLVALLSGVFFAALILTLRLQRGVASQAAVTWGSVAVTIALLPFVRNDLAIDRTSLLILVILGVVQIAIAYVALTEGLKYVTATEASLIGMIEPVANPLWVFLFLGERPGPYAIAGAVIVLLAIGVNTIFARGRTPEIVPVD